MSDDKTKWARGARTFGHQIKIKGGKRSGRAARTIIAAERRMERLFKFGIYGDRLSRPPIVVRGKEKREIKRQRREASSTESEKINRIGGRIGRLKRELDDIEENATQMKRAMTVPVILKQIEDAEREMSELLEDMRNRTQVVEVEFGDAADFENDDADEEIDLEEYARLADEQQRQYEKEEKE